MLQSVRNANQNVWNITVDKSHEDLSKLHTCLTVASGVARGTGTRVVLELVLTGAPIVTRATVTLVRLYETVTLRGSTDIEEYAKHLQSPDKQKTSCNFNVF